MDVAWHHLERQPLEILPAPLRLLGDHAVDPEAPAFGFHLGSRPGGQHRKALLDVLARRQAVFEPFLAAPPAGEAAGDEILVVRAHRPIIFRLRRSVGPRPLGLDCLADLDQMPIRIADVAADLGS